MTNQSFTSPPKLVPDMLVCCGRHTRYNWPGLAWPGLAWTDLVSGLGDPESADLGAVAVLLVLQRVVLAQDAHTLARVQCATHHPAQRVERGAVLRAVHLGRVHHQRPIRVTCQHRGPYVVILQHNTTLNTRSCQLIIKLTLVLLFRIGCCRLSFHYFPPSQLDLCRGRKITTHRRKNSVQEKCPTISDLFFFRPQTSH